MSDEQDIAGDEPKAAGAPSAAADAPPPEPILDAEPEPDPAGVPRLDQHPRFQEVIKQKNAYKAQLEQEREARLRAEAEAKAIRDLQARTAPAAPAAAPARRYAWAELERFVAEGKHSREEVEAYKEETARLMAEEAARRAMDERESSREVEGALQEFSRVVPGWDQPGHANNAKAEAEYRRLLQAGFPRTRMTELVALERAFGRVDTLKAAQRSEELTTTLRQPHRESGASQGQAGPRTDSARSRVQGLVSPGEFAAYDGYIRGGVYPSWEAVLEEVEWAAKQEMNPALAAKVRVR